MRTFKKHPVIKSTATVTVVAFFVTQLYLPNQGFAQAAPATQPFIQPSITEVALPTKFEPLCIKSRQSIQFLTKMMNMSVQISQLTIPVRLEPFW